MVKLKRIRPFLSLVLVAAVLAAGILYITGHPYLWKQLKRTPPLTSIAVLALYVIMFGVLMFILSASLRLCRLHLPKPENGSLNAWSLFINFFVPGQGGPAYRGAYLYKRHKLPVKSYILVTLLYYAIYAVVNVCLLLAGARPWWQTTAAAVLATAVGLGIINLYTKRNRLGKQTLNLSGTNIAYLFLATALQAVVQAAIYAVELHSAHSHIGAGQVITYTGAANLALFVSLTPGAIGIREAFLIFTERLHHISSANIIVANVIDRSVYLVFLMILLAVIVALHFKGRWRFKNLLLVARQSLD